MSYLDDCMREKSPGEALDQRIGAIERRVRALEYSHEADSDILPCGGFSTDDRHARWKRIEKAARNLTEAGINTYIDRLRDLRAALDGEG